MRITREQLQILDSYVCQRLTADPGNKKLVKNFSNDRNSRLAENLKECGWEDDVSGSATYYLIKDHQNRIVMYFSLKCGALFDPMDLEELNRQIETTSRTLEMVQRYRKKIARPEEQELVDQLLQDRNVRIFHLEHMLTEELEKLNKKYQEAMRDRNFNANGNITQVVQTYPAVELVHFVANDEYRVFWNRLAKKYGFGKPHTMAQVMFWYFAAPIISDIRKTLGCQYIYLFAADKSLNRRLINFYGSALHFPQEGDIGCNKPQYDFTCEFMYQEIDILRKFRQDYFDYFNLDPKADIV
jgi:hypothetical protein